MSVYFYGEPQIESMVRATRRFRLFFCAIAVIILAVASTVAFTHPRWIFDAHRHAGMWVMVALAVFVAGPLVDSLCRWRSRLAHIEASLRNTVIEISEAGARVEHTTSMQQLDRNEILRAEEVSWGLYLRTARRYRWLMIPSRIDGFQKLRHEIEALEIPIVRAAVPPNWEEIAGALIFAATFICAVCTHSVRLLTANLGISLLVAVAGFLIVSANPDNLPKMRWARFAIFLPVAMTASMLWIALQR